MYASDPRDAIGDRRRSPRLAAAVVADGKSVNVDVDIGMDAWSSTDNEWDTSSQLDNEAFAESSTSPRANSLDQLDQQAQEPPSHPLSRTSPTPPFPELDVLGDPSRPALQRATSMVERQVAESSRSASDFGGSGSLRGSFDLLRMSAVEEGQNDSAGEVEVLIHTIKPGESLAGIALLYGIDLPTLRKVNKLWASDPIHIRTHLYVPLEACRWNTASESLIRGPGEGQVTLAPKPISKTKTRAANASASGKGKEKELWSELSNPTSPPTGSPRLGIGLVETFMPSTSTIYERHSNTLTDIPSGLLGLDSGSTNNPSRSRGEPVQSQEIENDDDRTPRVLDIVRIPSSQLRFFPRAKHLRQPSGPSHSIQRTSFESSTSSLINLDDSKMNANAKAKAKERGHLRRSSSETNTNTQTYHTPSIIHDLSTLPPHLRPTPSNINSQSESILPPRSHTHTRSKTSNIVKLRPPQTQIQASQSQSSNGILGNGIANRLSALFTVPPPPPTYPHSITTLSRGGTPRLSLDSTYSTPRSSEAGSPANTSTRKQVSTKEENISMDFVSIRSSHGMGAGGAPDLGKIKARINNNNHKRKED